MNKNRRAQTFTIKNNRIFDVRITSDGHRISRQDFYYRRINGITPQPFTGPVDTLRAMAR